MHRCQGQYIRALIENNCFNCFVYAINRYVDCPRFVDHAVRRLQNDSILAVVDAGLIAVGQIQLSNDIKARARINHPAPIRRLSANSKRQGGDFEEFRQQVSTKTCQTSVFPTHTWTDRWSNKCCRVASELLTVGQTHTYQECNLPEY